MKLIYISAADQQMSCFEDDNLYARFPVSTAANGLGEVQDSECTPRGWHKIHTVIGQDAPLNAVFVARQWTGEFYSEALAAEFPERDWILTRILRLEGLEPGRNRGNGHDSFDRYIYIHGTPDSVVLGEPGSRGCIRMNNQAIMQLANWVDEDCRVFIE